MAHLSPTACACVLIIVIVNVIFFFLNVILNFAYNFIHCQTET